MLLLLQGLFGASGKTSTSSQALIHGLPILLPRTSTPPTPQQDYEEERARLQACPLPSPPTPGRVCHTHTLPQPSNQKCPNRVSPDPGHARHYHDCLEAEIEPGWIAALPENKPHIYVTRSLTGECDMERRLREIRPQLRCTRRPPKRTKMSSLKS